MFRLLVLGALLLFSCKEKSAAVPELPRVPEPRFRAPTLKCSYEAPSGWTASAAPMADQIAELIATAPDLRGRMVLREALDSAVPAVAEDQKQRTEAAWGAQPDFKLLREDPLGAAGQLIAYQWRPQPSAPIERHLIAVLPIDGKVVIAFIDDDGATPEGQLLATLGTLRCSPK